MARKGLLMNDLYKQFTVGIEEEYRYVILRMVL